MTYPAYDPSTEPATAHSIAQAQQAMEAAEAARRQAATITAQQQAANGGQS
ncbi:hypothetical protein ACTVZO_45330 [Streptomyces sp. IBSNAI002]|uniref:hypothetical protein n=1 Tax=Streptomyces sp. IBSNAI002 TaxID=3457500 RepID=UPI003FD30DE4